MKLKFYIRGVGIGIIVTAILMGLNHSGQNTKISDEEIISRAKEMGMYESIVVSGTTSNNTVEEIVSENIVVDSVSENKVVDTVSENKVVDTVSENKVIETVSDHEDSSSNSEENIDEVTKPEDVVITINSGEGSLSVCKKLVEAGLIEDAATYDAFLAANGYDKRIKTGNHIIGIGTSQEEIAQIISSK